MGKLGASVLLLLAYSVCAFLLCGNMASSLADLPMMSVGRSRDIWNVFLFGGLAVAAVVALPQVTPFIWPEFRPALSMTTWMLVGGDIGGHLRDRQAR